MNTKQLTLTEKVLNNLNKSKQAVNLVNVYYEVKNIQHRENLNLHSEYNIAKQIVKSLEIK